MGTLGADGSVETNWFVLLHRRVSARAVRSPRYQWWALVALLAGLLSLNITFTVFVVALPTVKADFHTNFSVLAWASTGPAAGLRRGRAVLRQGRRPLRPPPAVPVRPARGHGQRRSSRPPRPTSGCCCSPAPSTACRAPPPARRRWRSSSSSSRPRTGSRRWGGGRWWAPAGPVLGVTLGSPVIQFFGWRTLFWGQLVLLVIASVVVAVLLPSDRRRRGDAARPTGSDRRRAQRGATRVWEGMDWVGSWSLAGGRHRRHARAEHRPHRRAGPRPASIVAGVAAVVLAVVFVWRRGRPSPRRSCPPRTGAAATSCSPWAPRAFSSFAYFGGFFLFPLLMEQVYGYSVSQVGFISVARPLLFAISAPIAGYMTVRTGERTATLFGTGVAASSP